MLPRLEILLAATVLFIMGPTTSNAADVDNDGYVMLFNGKDLTNWQTKGNWVVEEGGILAPKPNPGKRSILSYKQFLWTTRRFTDFVLDFEYKLAKDGDTSVFLRSRSLFKFIEVEICDSYGKKGPLTDDDCGGVHGVTAPAKNMAKPAGEWNRMTITFKGNQLRVELNGEPVVDVDLFKASDKVIPSSGNIGLQDWGHPLWFRNVRIKLLK